MQKGNILGHELIGLSVTIIDAANKQLLGLSGIIIDETKNTIMLEVKGKKKRVLKKDITVRIDKYIVDGKLLLGRPEERIKVKQ